MASKRLMSVGNYIMNSRDSSTNNISNILDKSVNTNSTYETPKRSSTKLVLNPLYSNKKEAYLSKRLSTELRYNSPISNNISQISGNKLIKSTKFNYITTEPRKESIELLNQADNIVKGRTKNNLMLNLMVKSTILDKTKKINLENYKIKLIRNKRDELNTRIFEVNNALKLNEKIFEKDYRDFLDLVDKNNAAQKKTEEYMLKLKNKTEQTEKELNEQNLKIKKIRIKIENIVKQILLLKRYGTFVNKLFKNEFIYDKIKRDEGKNYFNIAEDLIKIYESSDKKKEQEKEEEFKLNEQEYESWLIKQYINFENGIINLMNERQIYYNEIINIQDKAEKEYKRLNKEKKKLEKHDETLNNNDDMKYIKSTIEYTPPELMNEIIDYIYEFAELFGLNTNIDLFKEKTPINYVSISHKILQKISETENFINNRIETFENLINSENLEERNLIEKIINERKKEIKKEKFLKLLKKQKEEDKINNMKRIEKANKFVIKWRKINIEYPFKKKKKKKIIIEENHDDDILFYSDDEKK